MEARSPIGGVVVSISASKPSGCWFKSCRPAAPQSGADRKGQLVKTLPAGEVRILRVRHRKQAYM